MTTFGCQLSDLDLQTTIWAPHTTEGISRLRTRQFVSGTVSPGMLLKTNPQAAEELSFSFRVQHVSSGVVIERGFKINGTAKGINCN